MSGTQQTQQEQENTSQPIKKKKKGRRLHKKQPTKVTIKNLTDYQLTKGEISLLSKGLKFAPVPKGKDLIEMRADFNLFARRVRIKQFFDKDQPPPATSSFKTPSGWTPPRGVSTNLESYLHGVEGDLLRWKKTKQPKSNLTLEEIAALDSLKNNHDIVIKPADKGGAVVIWEKSDYIKEAERQLNNQRDYTKLPSDHTKKANQTIGNYFKRCKKNKLLPPIGREPPRNPNSKSVYLLPTTQDSQNRSHWTSHRLSYQLPYRKHL